MVPNMSDDLLSSGFILSAIEQNQKVSATFVKNIREKEQ
jgi:hypothetical protein